MNWIVWIGSLVSIAGPILILGIGFLLKNPKYYYRYWRTPPSMWPWYKVFPYYFWDHFWGMFGWIIGMRDAEAGLSKWDSGKKVMRTINLGFEIILLGLLFEKLETIEAVLRALQ